MSLSVISLKIDGWLFAAAFLATCSNRRAISSDRLLHPQSDQSQGRTFVEQHDQDGSAADKRDVDVSLFTLVETDW
jgi:hypothetical protein